MASQSTQDDATLDTNAFYRRTLHVLGDAGVPFLVGGSHAYLHYTGIARNTKDLDLFVRRSDVADAIAGLEAAGYRTEITFPHWLAKAIDGDNFVDLIFSSGNGVAIVDDGWFDHSVEAEVLGLPVKLVPAEEFIWQKSFVMERERFDGADVAHLLHAYGDRLNWDRIVERYADKWPLLLTHLVLFRFIYPAERTAIPPALFTELLTRMQGEVANDPGEQRICQGTLLSRGQFMIDLGPWGYRDARLEPVGNMRAEDIVYWTWAIENIK